MFIYLLQCTSVNDLLVHQDDTFIAVTSQDPYHAGGYYAGGYLGDDPYYRQGYHGYNKHPMAMVRQQQPPRFTGRDSKCMFFLSVAYGGGAELWGVKNVSN